MGSPFRLLAAGSIPSFWTRLGNAFLQAPMRRVEGEIAAYLELHGGRFTDQTERRILDRVCGIDRQSFNS
jgi:hypothetical protein